MRRRGRRAPETSRTVQSSPRPVGVRAHHEQVARLLDGDEALARHVHGAGALEHADRRAHRRLELDDLGRGRVRRVDRLAVDDHRQLEHAVALAELLVERAQAHPDVVGVEVAVDARCPRRPPGRRRGPGPSRAAAGRRPERRRARWPPLRSLSVRSTTSDTNGRPSLASQPRIARLERRAEVVGVRQEQVLVAALEQLGEQARRGQRGEHVAVAGRRPLERRVGGPLGRRRRRRRAASAPCPGGSRAAGRRP